MSLTKEVAVIAGSSSLRTAVPRTGRPLVYVALGLLGLLILLVGLSTMNGGDYVRYYRCAEVAFLHGQNPYACLDYFQAPPTLHLMAPFAALGTPLDAWAWSLFIGGCTFAALVVLLVALRMLEQRAVVLALTLGLCPFTLFLLIYQQATALVLLIEALALWLIVRGRYTGAAVVVALAVFKPHLMLVILPLLAPLPRRVQVLCVALAGGILVALSWPYTAAFLHELQIAGSRFNHEHATVELKELTDYFSDAAGWRLFGYALLIPPFLYFCYQTYRLRQARALDLVLVAKLLPAGLLFLPYNRAYDWVLAIPAYLILWELLGRRWTPLLAANILLAWLAFPVSTYTFLQGSPISINPLPLLLLIVSLEHVARAHPDRAAALRVPSTEARRAPLVGYRVPSTEC